MSSDMKDARWGLAFHYAEQAGMVFEDYTYPGWQKLLDQAQLTLDREPDDIAYWANEFRSGDE